jgi:microcystin-dependent protein
MSTPYVGEIRCFGFNFAPQGWAICQGQLMSIAGNDTLFNLIGTTYGGDGLNTFALPDLRGRVPMHQGTSSQLTTVIGELMGTETVTLLTPQIPSHAHTIVAEMIAPGGAPEHAASPTSAAFIGTSNPDGIYNSSPMLLNASFSPKTIGNTGSSIPHDNMQPYLVLNFCIALFGVYPTQS